jgi:pSer/pThr/pTyr-binding forkhead associated (FHA) protein
MGRRHAALLLRKKQLYAQDLRSGYPTLVNGVPLTPGQRVPVKAGDRLLLGPMEFVLDHRARTSTPKAAPYAAPPLPVGRPAGLAFDPATSPFRTASKPARSSVLLSVVLLAGLTTVGLGTGVLLSRFLIGGKEDGPQVAERVRPSDESRTPRTEVQPPKPQDWREEGKPTPDQKPAEKKNPAPPAEKPKPKPEVKPRPVEKPAPKPEEKPVPKPEEKPTPKPEVKPTPKPEVKPVPKPEEKPKPKAEEKPKPAPANQVAYARDVMPIFKERCFNCHREGKAKGGVNLTSIEAILKGGENGAILVPGMLDKSLLWRTIDEDTMPPAGKPLTKEQKKMIEKWIAQATDGKVASR